MVDILRSARTDIGALLWKVRPIPVNIDGPLGAHIDVILSRIVTKRDEMWSRALAEVETARRRHMLRLRWRAKHRHDKDRFLAERLYYAEAYCSGLSRDPADPDQWAWRQRAKFPIAGPKGRLP